MSETATSQDFNASVSVENESAITLSVELTDAIREYALTEAGESLRAALAVFEAGIDTQKQALEFASAAKEASKNAEVVYTLTLAGKWDEDERSEA